jgi:calcineurin-like phosphoesterase family protein
MNERLIRAWNAVVHSDDTIYFLGDLLMGNYGQARNLLGCLNGRILIVPGNHDKWLGPFSNVAQPPDLFSATGQKVEILPPLLTEKFHIAGQKEPVRIVLCHYPLREWDGWWRGSLHCFGHTHSNLKPEGRSLDVGVDVFPYPVSLETVINTIGVD